MSSEIFSISQNFTSLTGPLNFDQLQYCLAQVFPSNIPGTISDGDQLTIIFPNPLSSSDLSLLNSTIANYNNIYANNIYRVPSISLTSGTGQDAINWVDQNKNVIAGIDTNGNFYNQNRSYVNLVDVNSSQSITNKDISDPSNSVPIREMAILSHTETNGTNGGTFNNGQWITRTLNNISGYTPSGFISMNNNQFTLENGIYQVYATVPAHNVGSHQACLYNVNTNTIVAYGTSVADYVNQTISSVTTSVINIILQVTSPTIYCINHQCMSSFSNSGLGLSCGMGQEVYTQVMINKLS